MLEIWGMSMKKNMLKMFKVNIKSTVCDIVLVSLLLTSEAWVLRTQSNIYNGALFVKIVDWQKLKVSTGF